MMVWIIDAALVLVIIVLLVKKQSDREDILKDKLNKKEKAYKQAWDDKLKNEWENLSSSQLKRYNEYKEDIDRQIEVLQSSYKRQKDLLDTIKTQTTEEINNHKLLIDKELEIYKEQQLHDIDKTLTDNINNANLTYQVEKAKINALLENIEQSHYMKINQWKEEEQSILAELEDYRKRRGSITQAILREKEIQEKEEFYRIIISQQDEEDIAVLKEIAPRLKNHESLNKLIYDVFMKRPTTEMIKRVTSGNKIGGIYKVTYIKTGESYIGRSTDIGARWKQHVLSSLNIGTIAHSSFHTFMSKKGIQNFTWEILEVVPKEQQSEREKYWINFYETNKQLNSNLGG